MTQDEIIEMAKESDLGFLLGDSWLMHHEIEYFAKLVVEKERKRILDVIGDNQCECYCSEVVRGQA